MLQPELMELLGSATPMLIVEKIPVSEDGEFKSQLLQHKGEETENSPFEFSPQRLPFAAEDDFFEFRCHIAGCRQLFDTLEGYEHHYNSLHRNVCSNCKRSFPSNRLLEIHILEWHDSLFQVLAEKQCMYECLVEGCGLKLKTSKERKDHLVKLHSYPPDFRFDRPKKTGRTRGRTQQQDGDMEVSATTSVQHESSESMDFSQSADCLRPAEHDSPKTCFSYKVPSSICFGQGSVRGFRGRRKK
ncbi:hypothetical protein DNTS_034420 [Danionella cerebrum]|uniref:C2H2-type domain-containing protein n=1 Tax=Danionella cerebrum TaxID=2873325 RepID=A0A553MQF9_9TELE|nr:hypothetical protein DNTS_034420 [Danionella translucida]